MNAIIVHGGAWAIPDDIARETRKGCRLAALLGKEVLDSGGSAVDAVETSVRIMELDPIFDAGKGSVLTMKGEIEMDALIMDGNGLKLGSVAAVKSILHPISLARKVMEETPHCLMVGLGADLLAERFGFPRMEHEDLLTAVELARWEIIRDKGDFDIHQEFRLPEVGGPSPVQSGLSGTSPGPSDTVGACALDDHGNVASAVSTGGTSLKYPGRVGDTPLVGCGGYADNRYGAVSATGLGEYLMRFTLSSRVMYGLEQGGNAEYAARDAIIKMENDIEGLGGVIVIGKDGTLGFAYNTPRMAYAWVDKDGRVESGL